MSGTIHSIQTKRTVGSPVAGKTNRPHSYFICELLKANISQEPDVRKFSMILKVREIVVQKCKQKML